MTGLGLLPRPWRRALIDSVYGAEDDKGMRIYLGALWGILLVGGLILTGFTPWTWPATREAQVKHGRESLEAIVGTPLKGETIAGETFDGETEAAVFPGELPADPREAFRGEALAGADADWRFARFRPPRLAAGADGKAPVFALVIAVIGTRMGLGFAVVLLLMAFIAASGLLRLENVGSATNEMVNGPQVKERLVAQWASEVKANIVRTYAMVKSTDAAYEEYYKKGIGEGSARISPIQKKLEGMLDTPEEKKIR